MGRETRAPLRDGLHLKADDRGAGADARDRDYEMVQRVFHAGFPVRLRSSVMVALWALVILGAAFAAWRGFDGLVDLASGWVLAVLP